MGERSLAIEETRSLHQQLTREYFVYTSETKDTDIPKETMTHLRVDSSVTEIPVEAFKHCHALVEVQVSETSFTTMRIMKCAFYACVNLKYVQFVSSDANRRETYSALNRNLSMEEGLTLFTTRGMLQIDEGAFYHCDSLCTIAVGSVSTRLGEGVFCNCYGLISVALAAGLQVIPVEAFRHCPALEQVQLPETLSRIEERAFFLCFKLKRVRFVSNDPHQHPLTNLSTLDDGTIVFPERVLPLQVDEDAFTECNSLRKVIVCSVSTKLIHGVFRCCSGLISVELPEGLQVIEPRLFFECESLITIKIPSTVIKICDDAFDGCSSLTLIDGLPPGLVEIGGWAFRSCHSIETLRIPSTVSSIQMGAFNNCRGLEHIELPSSLERIEKVVFKGCRSLEYIEIPSTVSFIGDRAFNECYSLSHIRIPSSVESIDPSAVTECRRLISIELPEESSFELDLSECRSLVNVYGAIEYTSLKQSKLGSSTVDDEADLNRKLKHRFGNSPLNKLCYYQSYYTSEEAMVQLRNLMEQDDPVAATAQVDEFGMTPLHVLSLSQTPNVDILLALMNEGNVDHIIHGTDSFGATPMDYLCLNRAPNSTEVIRRVVQTRFDYWLGFLDRSPKSDTMRQAVEEALVADWPSRRREIGRVYFELANYEQRMKILSLLELYLWKIKIEEVRSKEQTIANRKSCRINNGASIVLPHVLPFLDKLNMEDYVGSSPDLSSVDSSSAWSSDEEEWSLT